MSERKATATAKGQRKGRAAAAPDDDDSDEDRPAPAPNIKSRLRQPSSQSTRPQPGVQPNRSLIQGGVTTAKRSGRTQEPQVGSSRQNAGASTSSRTPASASLRNGHGQAAQAQVTPGTPVRSEAERSRQAQREAAREKDTMIKNGILYFNCNTGNKLPIKRTEFMQRVIGKEKDPKLVHSVIKKVHRTMEKVFGYTIWGYNDSTGEVSPDIGQAANNVWFVISKHKGITKLINKVKSPGEGDRVQEVKQGLLVMFLTIIFMQNFESGIEESQLWGTVTAVEFDIELELVEKDFKKFMKTEYIAPMYLRAQDERNEEQGVTITRYIWGPRSHLEFSKWSLLKHAIRQFPGTTPLDFPGPHQYILNSEEAQVARKEFREWEKYGQDSDSSVEEDEVEESLDESDEENRVSTSTSGPRSRSARMTDTRDNGNESSDE